MEMDNSKVCKVPWNIQNSALTESAVDALVDEEERRMGRKFSESEKRNKEGEITTFFTGNEINETVGLRQLILDDLRHQIKKMVVDSAVQRKLDFYVSQDSIIKREVTNFSHVKLCWKYDGSNQNFKSMVHICFLDFDTNPNWKERLEQWILEKYDLVYFGAPMGG